MTKKHIINNLLCDIHYFRVRLSASGNSTLETQQALGSLAWVLDRLCLSF